MKREDIRTAFNLSVATMMATDRFLEICRTCDTRGHDGRLGNRRGGEDGRHTQNIKETEDRIVE